jgi:hypothetical protein
MMYEDKLEGDGRGRGVLTSQFHLEIIQVVRDGIVENRNRVSTIRVLSVGWRTSEPNCSVVPNLLSNMNKTKC